MGEICQSVEYSHKRLQAFGLGPQQGVQGLYPGLAAESAAVYGVRLVFNSSFFLFWGNKFLPRLVFSKILHQLTDLCIHSSDDDIDILLHGTPEQRRRLRRKSLGQRSSSSEDEFEKEMREELDETMRNIQQNQSSDRLFPVEGAVCRL